MGKEFKMSKPVPPQGNIGNEMERASAVASRIGVQINDHASPHMWTVPLLEKLVERIEKLEVAGILT